MTDKRVSSPGGVDASDISESARKALGDIPLDVARGVSHGEDETMPIEDIPPKLLRSGADTYERKNADYGASWYEIGEVLYKMAGEEPVTLDSPEDWVRAGLYTRRLDKMFRSFTGEFRAESMNYESTGDAHEDEGVYAHMAAAVAMMEQADEQRTDG